MTIKKLITDKKLSTSYPQPVDNSYNENLEAVLDLIFGPKQDIGKAKAIFFSELDRANVQGEIYDLANTLFNAVSTYLGNHSCESKDLSDKDKQLLKDLDNVGNAVKIEPVKDDVKSRLIRILSSNIKEGKILGMFSTEDCLYVCKHWDEAKTIPGFVKFTEDGLEPVVKDDESNFSTAYAIVVDAEDLPKQFVEDMDPIKALEQLFTSSKITKTENDELINNVFATDGSLIDVVIDWPSGTVSIDNTDEMFSYIDFGGIASCLSNIAYDKESDKWPAGSFKFMGYRYANSNTISYPVSISELCDFGSKKPISLVFKFTKDPRA